MVQKEPISSFMFSMILKVIDNGCLKEPFSVGDVNRCCTTLMHSPSFLSKHAVDNPGGYTPYFIRVEPGKYKVNSQYR